MTTGERIAHWRWLWIPVAFMITTAGWAITSPIGSAPDDDFHLASIWCTAGAPHCVTGNNPEALDVPRNVVQAADCYRYDSSITADCTAAVADDSTLVPVRHVNQLEGIYPGGFYGAMSVLVSDDVGRSVLLMRLANVLLISLLLALLLRTAPAGIAFATSGALAITFVPLGLFVVGSTNPSAWAASGLLLFWGFALSLLRRRDWRSRRTWLLAIGTVITGLMTITSRLDAAAYLVVTAVVVAVLTGPHLLRRNLASAIVVGAVSLVGVVTYLTFDTPGSGSGDATMGTASRGLGLLLTNAVQLPTLLQGAVGGWALGWNDTVMPPLVAFVGLIAIGGAVWAGLSRVWPGKIIALTIAVVTLVFTPLWFLQKEGLGVGEVVQPRYILPLLAIVVATLLLDRRPTDLLPWPRPPAWTLALLLGASASLAFWANVHRYSYGPEVGLFDIRVAPVWLGPLQVSPVVIAAVVTLASLAWTIGSLVPPRPASPEFPGAMDRVRG